MNKLTLMTFLLPLGAAWQAAAQSWDTSGNGLLNGTYYFRQVIWAVEDNAGDVGEAISVYGTINFNGNGQYTISNVQLMDSGVGTPCTIPQGNCTGYPTSGTYSISASGYGFLDSLVSNDEVYGLVSKGIFVASQTENTSCQSGNTPCYNDLFIAVPVAATPLTNSAFQGTYAMADLDFTGAGVQNGVLYTRGSTFQLTPDGNGNVPAFRATGYITGNGSSETVQNVSAVHYSFSSGAANWPIGGSISSGNVNTVLIAGTKYLYLSPDGNFVFGGSPTGWDMIVGVRTSTGGSPSFSGLYYQAGALVDNSQLSSSGYADLETYYGSYNSTSSGLVLAHQRLYDALGESTTDYTYSDSVSSSNGTYSDSFNQYLFSNGGAVGIGFSTLSSAGAQLGIAVLLQAPSFSPSGVYIYPTGVVNAGSSAPFTAQLAPGELISIYGTNLASTTATDLTLPLTLGGVQVMINGQAAPLAFVSPGQINATVPIGISSGSIASIQVINGTSSNVVTNFVGDTQPGVFNSVTLPAVQHANYSMVTSSSPAQPGETLLVYLTGLGELSSIGNATNQIAAYFEDPTNGNLTATVAFAGSQSTIGGGYQLNVVVPSNISSGNIFLDIAGPDSYNSEVAIPVGSSSSAALRKSSRIRPQPSNRTRPRSRRHPKTQ